MIAGCSWFPSNEFAWSVLHDETVGYRRRGRVGGVRRIGRARGRVLHRRARRAAGHAVLAGLPDRHRDGSSPRRHVDGRQGRPRRDRYPRPPRGRRTAFPRTPGSPTFPSTSRWRRSAVATRRSRRWPPWKPPTARTTPTISRWPVRASTRRPTSSGRPSANGFIRHVDAKTGVPDWWQADHPVLDLQVSEQGQDGGMTVGSARRAIVGRALGRTKPAVRLGLLAVAAALSQAALADELSPINAAGSGGGRAEGPSLYAGGDPREGRASAASSWSRTRTRPPTSSTRPPSRSRRSSAAARKAWSGCTNSTRGATRSPANSIPTPRRAWSSRSNDHARSAHHRLPRGARSRAGGRRRSGGDARPQGARCLDQPGPVGRRAGRLRRRRLRRSHRRHVPRLRTGDVERRGAPCRGGDAVLAQRPGWRPMAANSPAS